MDASAAKFIGAGLAVLPLLGVGLGLGALFSSTITAMGRNPSVGAQVHGKTLLYFAFIEAVALFALLIAVLILFSK